MAETMSSNPLAYGMAAPDYRLPSGTRMGRVRLQVGDISRSLAFYERLLGFRVITRSAGHASLGTAASDDVLFELIERRGARPAAVSGRLGLYHFAVLLPDRPSLGRILALLDQEGMRPGMADHAVSESLYLSDPDSLGIEIYADRPREEWLSRGRELLMVTEPLDTASLLRDAGGEPWSGMPAGTTIGHIHLHVANLDAASRLFHTALGLDRVVWSYRGALFLSAGGYHHHLGVNVWAGPDASPAEEDEARLIDWEIVVPTREAALGAVDSLKRTGYEVAEAEGGAWATTDPWGSGVRIRAE